MKVLLVGSYEFDGATSIKIWANALLRGLLQQGIDARIISPKPVFGTLKRSSGGLGKWLGYIDRFIIFPRVLRSAAARADVVHICDHGSAMYVLSVKDKPVLVTLNDMLAVRGAIGEIPDCPASFFGRRMQHWIRQGLSRADLVVCVSKYTMNDAHRLLMGNRRRCVIPNGLTYPFQPLDSSEVDRRLAGLTAIQEPFVLHVGSNLARKNRDGILRIFAQAAEKTNLQMVFAGEALSPDLVRLAKELKVHDRIVQVVGPKVEILEALYNRAVALLFPSRYEGFGVPPIEAQACGCPVVASDIPPHAEVLGQSAALRPLDDEAGMAEEILRLATDREYREETRQRGFENVRTRYRSERMTRAYVALYRELACQS
ncbi:MAG: glycosyltransferase family 1 protein [Terracidiphilus sp.]|jgi:glycosyltransferase involved in cell wall biosynthesis